MTGHLKRLSMNENLSRRKRAICHIYIQLYRILEKAKEMMNKLLILQLKKSQQHLYSFDNTLFSGLSCNQFQTTSIHS